MSIREKLQARRAKRLQKKKDRLEFLLSTTAEERKEIKKAQKVARMVRRLQKLRGRRPFDLKCVRWYEKRLIEKSNGETKSADRVPPGEFDGGVATA